VKKSYYIVRSILVFGALSASPWGRQWTDLPKAGDRNNDKRWTTRLNYPVQAAEAEGLKEALALLHPELHFDWKLVNVIHDAIVLEVPKADAADAAKVLHNCMIEGMGRVVKTVPIMVDVSTSANGVGRDLLRASGQARPG